MPRVGTHYTLNIRIFRRQIYEVILTNGMQYTRYMYGEVSKQQPNPNLLEGKALFKGIAQRIWEHRI